MTDADYHLGCDSLVRITPEDIKGPFGYVFEWSKHPSYPEVPVASCELAADHMGRCEMFVDTTSADAGKAHPALADLAPHQPVQSAGHRLRIVHRPCELRRRESERLPLHPAGRAPRLANSS
jgi:hypothetical protein